jgi:hypothetical protein
VPTICTLGPKQVAADISTKILLRTTFASGISAETFATHRLHFRLTATVTYFRTEQAPQCNRSLRGGLYDCLHVTWIDCNGFTASLHTDSSGDASQGSASILHLLSFGTSGHVSNCSDRISMAESFPLSVWDPYPYTAVSDILGARKPAVAYT